MILPSWWKPPQSPYTLKYFTNCSFIAVLHTLIKGTMPGPRNELGAQKEQAPASTFPKEL